VAPRSPQVCACHDVSEDAIVTQLRLSVGDAGQRLQQLQAQLRCGTDCGSCLPALKLLVQREGLEAVAP
jgi:assimilatory nitrate reductase catalytic subunit